MIRKILSVSLIKTLMFNIHYFGLSGLKFPVLVSKKTILKKMKGCVKIENPTFGCVHLGFDAIGIFDYSYDRTIWENFGEIFIEHNAVFGHGTRISNFGKMFFSNGFRVTADTSFISHDSISFGENCLVSWNCRFMDTDFHKIMDYSNNVINPDAPIVIGKNIWIGCGVSILKNTYIADNNVIASNSLISGKKIDVNNKIIGNHGVILKENIRWIP